MANVEANSLAKLNIVYEDFEPTIDWVHDARYDTLLVYLPDFKREQLKVQVTSAGKLRILGERPLGDNTWSRFHQELPIPSHCDSKQISAKFERGTLCVKHPKFANKAKPQENENSSAQTPEQMQKPTNEPQAQQNGQKQATREVPPESKTGKQTSEMNDGVANINAVSQKTPQKAQEVSDVNGKISTASDAYAASQKSLNNKKSGALAEEGKSMTISEKQENLGEFVYNAANMDEKAIASVSGPGKSKLVHYRQVLGVLVTQMKKQRKSASLALAGLLVLVLVLFVRKSVRALGESEN